MSLSEGMHCFPRANRTEAARDTFEWDVNLHLIFFFLFLADDTILVLSQQSFWLEKIKLMDGFLKA